MLFPFFESGKVRRDKKIQLGGSYRNETRRKTETFKEREANDAAHAMGSPRPLSSPRLWSEGRISSVLSPQSPFFRLHRAQPFFLLPRFSEAKILIAPDCNLPEWNAFLQ